MKALTVGPHQGWHFHRSTFEWKYYRHGRAIASVAAECWEEYKHWRNTGVLR